MSIPILQWMPPQYPLQSAFLIWGQLWDVPVLRSNRLALPSVAHRASSNPSARPATPEKAADSSPAGRVKTDCSAESYSPRLWDLLEEAGKNVKLNMSEQGIQP